jgi:hypothetical protein
MRSREVIKSSNPLLRLTRCNVSEEMDMWALSAVVFLVLNEARIDHIERREMVKQILTGKVMGRPARFAFIRIILDLLPLAVSRFLLRENDEVKDTPRSNLSGAFGNDVPAVPGTEKVEKIETIQSVIRVIAERHVEHRTPKIANQRVRCRGETYSDIGDLDAVNGKSFSGKKFDMPPVTGSRNKNLLHTFLPEEFHRLEGRPAGRIAPDPPFIRKSSVPIIPHPRLL